MRYIVDENKKKKKTKKKEKENNFFGNETLTKKKKMNIILRVYIFQSFDKIFKTISIYANDGHSVRSEFFLLTDRSFFSTSKSPDSFF